METIAFVNPEETRNKLKALGVNLKDKDMGER